MLSGRISLNYFTTVYLPWQRTASTDCGQQFQIACHFARYYVTARGLFLAYGEDGDGGLDQATEQGREPCTVQKPCVVTLRPVTVAAVGLVA